MRPAMKPRRRLGCRWWRELRPRQSLKKPRRSQNLEHRVLNSELLALNVRVVHEVEQVLIAGHDEHATAGEGEIHIHRVIRIASVPEGFVESVQERCGCLQRD